MAGLTIGWEYLTGYAVATDATNRERAEWPPHPGRVYMALAAAWFETGKDSAEGEALRWLESLDTPELHFLPSDKVAERSLVTFYVPINDRVGPAAATLQSLPAMTRNKKPRTFPRVYVGNAPCMMHWPEAEDLAEHREALDRLCSKVTRIGHSSSLVQMWTDTKKPTQHSACHRFTADDAMATFHVRELSNGFLDMLTVNFGEEPRQRQEYLQERLTILKARKKTIKGQGARERKATLDEQMTSLKEELEVLEVYPPVRPVIGLWSGYSRVQNATENERIRHGHFDTDLLILVRVSGPELPLVSTLALNRALRGAVMAHSDPVPQWVSGHQPNGERSEASSGHLACIPLPFVGYEHADGHLLGVGLGFPRSVDRRERGRVLGPLLLEKSGEPRQVDLTLGRLGVWKLRKTNWSERRSALQARTWTAHPRGTRTWASVTPVVLDRFPKTDRRKDRNGWNIEVAGIVASSCERIGLPTPEAVDIDTTAWHRGAPRAFTKQRRLRGHSRSDSHEYATLGNGFPAYPPKGTKAPRVQVHVWLRFSEPVLGPILLGAGRFQGYGLCKPWRGKC